MSDSLTRAAQFRARITVGRRDVLRYFLTFACYGAHLHGDESGSVDRHNNLFGTRVAAPYPERATVERDRMKQSAYQLDRERREVVLEALQQVCQQRGWSLFAAHVRSNHVQSIVEVEVSPEKVMGDFKAYASRALNARAGGEDRGQRRWARHGSTRWLWKDQDVRDAIRYVIEEQGAPMAVYLGEVP